MIGTKTVLRGMAVVAAAAVLAMPMGLAPAQATPDYPPSFYKISATSYNVRVGTTVKFTAQTFQAGSNVSVAVKAKGASTGSASATANAKGIATTSVTFDTVGVNTVTMSGTSDKGDPLALATDVTVRAADETVTSPGGGDNSGGNAGGGGDNAGGVPFLGGGLPRTGGEIAATVLVAAALVGLGALLVIFTRRRRAT